MPACQWGSSTLRGRLVVYASQGLAHTSSAPQVSSPVLILQLFEWEFSLMKVKELFLGAPLILPLARGQSQGRGHPWASSVPWPPLSFGEISLCKGGFGGLLIFHISMVTCSQTFQRATSDCTELKVSFWCVKFYSLGERKTRKLQNKDWRKLEQVALVFFLVALKLANTI